MNIVSQIPISQVWVAKMAPKYIHGVILIIIWRWNNLLKLIFWKSSKIHKIQGIKRKIKEKDFEQGKNKWRWGIRILQKSQEIMTLERCFDQHALRNGKTLKSKEMFLVSLSGKRIERTLSWGGEKKPKQHPTVRIASIINWDKSYQWYISKDIFFNGTIHD